MTGRGTPYGEHADRLTALLGLSLPPVAVALSDDAPAGVERFAGQVPSTCALWREAEEALFWADSPAHFNCSVGAFVMGFALPDSVGEDLGQSLSLMAEAGYMGEQEPGSVPTMPPGETTGVLYGPLALFPRQPDAVLLWVAPVQGMLVSEAAGTADWRAAGGARVLGRPGCAALPLAHRDGLPVLSFGCTGMRTFTAIPDDLGLAVVPGGGLDDFVQRLEDTVRANADMRRHYEQRLADLTAEP